MVYIYILRCLGDKYYVGQTNNSKFRIKNHTFSNGKEWIDIYKPIEIIEFITECDKYDVDKYTIKYMDKFGINNVRGGTWSYPKLDYNDILFLKKIIKNLNKECINCGGKGHQSENCFMFSDNTNNRKEINFENIGKQLGESFGNVLGTTMKEMENVGKTFIDTFMDTNINN